MPWLEWHNRNDDLKAMAKTPYRLLQPVQSLSHGDEDAPNMLSPGDNLEALKALLPYYAGQVKCIFIDPPYNTKSAFEHYDDNLEHAKWLSMMYPRMVLLRELLSEDGSIWITLDDNEAHYFRILKNKFECLDCLEKEDMNEDADSLEMMETEVPSDSLEVNENDSWEETLNQKLKDQTASSQNFSETVTLTFD